MRPSLANRDDLNRSHKRHATFARTSAGGLLYSQRLDAAALELRGRLKNLRYDSSAGLIALDEMVLVEDDAPAIGRPEGAGDRSWFEHLHRGIVVRKDLVLDDARARAAYLLFNGREQEQNDHPLYLRINGNELVRCGDRVRLVAVLSDPASIGAAI